MARASSDRIPLTPVLIYYCLLQREKFALMAQCGTSGERTTVPQKRHFPLIWTSVPLGPIKINYVFHGSRALRQPDTERFLKKNII